MCISQRLEPVKITDDILMHIEKFVHDGACQCFGDCDCYKDKGKILKLDITYTNSLSKHESGPPIVFLTLENCQKRLYELKTKHTSSPITK